MARKMLDIQSDPVSSNVEKFNHFFASTLSKFEATLQSASSQYPRFQVT